MVRFTKKSAIPFLFVLIAVITSAEAQAGAWYPSPNLNKNLAQ